MSPARLASALPAVLLAAALTAAGLAAPRVGVPSPLPAGLLWTAGLLPAADAARVVAADGVRDAPARWLTPAVGPPLGLSAWAAYALARMDGPPDAPTWAFVVAAAAASLLATLAGAGVGALVRRYRSRPARANA